ncbi:MAG: S9 family peptidase [Planctomycetes bacterium]|nr:S9 family peptidase [Planctomycetota bacterium]
MRPPSPAARAAALALLVALAPAAAARAADAPPRVPAPGPAPGAPAAPPPPAATPRAAPDPAPWLEVAGASLSGVALDGSSVFFRMTYAGATQVFRVGRDGGWPVRLTFRSEGVDFAVPSPDGRWLVLGYDRDGDENHGLFLRPTDGGPERPLAVVPGVQHGDVHWSRAGDRLFFRSNPDGGADQVLWSLAVADGSATRVLARPGRWSIEDVDRDARRLLVSREVSSRARTLHVLSLADGTLTDVDPPPTGREVLPGDAHFALDATAVVFVSDRDGEWRRAYRWHAADGRVEPLPRAGDAAGEADVEALEVGPDGTQAVVVEDVAGRSRVTLLDLAAGTVRPGPALGDAVVASPRLDTKGALFLTVLRADAPPVVHRWDGAGPAVPLTVPDRAGLDPASLAVQTRAVSIESFDGRRVPAWLWLPPGREPKGLPFVLHLHGGPAVEERPTFSAERAYLLSLGFGVLAPNVRGSTGSGRTWRDLDDGPRRMDAVRDAKAARDWLVAQGLADPRRIAAHGGSYGGFMVLALLTEHPDDFAAGVEAVGIANFETFLERTAGYRRANRESEYGSLADRALLRAISPIHRVDRIRAPLLVGHGQNDPRVPVGEARQIVDALEARGRTVEALIFPDEGHGFSRRENRVRWVRAVGTFLLRHVAAP